MGVKKTQFNLEGIEVLEKEVKAFGGTGHIYIPKKYIGKKVKVVI